MYPWKGLLTKKKEHTVTRKTETGINVKRKESLTLPLGSIYSYL